MQYNKAKNDQAISSMEKSMERLAKKIQDRIGSGPNRSSSHNNKPPPISFNHVPRPDANKAPNQLEQAQTNVAPENKLHVLGRIPNPPPSHPSRGVHLLSTGCLQEQSFSENIDHLIEKSHMHSSERSFQKLAHGIDTHLSHMAKDAANTMHMTSLSEMAKSNDAAKAFRPSHLVSQLSQADVRRSPHDSVSFVKETERSSQYDMDQFKSVLERQVHDFMRIQQPVIQQQAQQMRQLLDTKTASVPLADSHPRPRPHVASLVSYPSASKISMGQILESNRSLIKEMQE